MRNAYTSSLSRALIIPGGFALAIMLGLGAPTAARAAAPALEPRVVVVFDHPEKFLDIRIWRNSADEVKDRDNVLAIFRDFITRRAVSYLPEGDHLLIRFTDIKLAGEFPPGGIRDTRIITRHKPPVFVFSWTVTNRSGTVVRTGSEELMETAFLELYGGAQDGEAYHFEKAVLDDWMRRNLRI
jgi:hypothetical protein